MGEFFLFCLGQSLGNLLVGSEEGIGGVRVEHDELFKHGGIRGVTWGRMTMCIRAVSLSLSMSRWKGIRLASSVFRQKSFL
jgi:hypothetical protein